MFLAADGSVIIDTKFNTDGVEIGAKDIENTLRKSADAIGSYDKSVQDYVDNYVSNMEAATKSNNEFRREIETLKKNLKDLEGKGLYFGDEEYDNTYLKLQKVQQALKDYKKELISPTPNALPLDISTLEGQIDKLALDLQRLKDRGKTFGDETFDSTYKAFQKANQELKDYKNQLVKPVQIPVDIDSMQGKINALKSQLDDLGKQGKTFGDATFDSTYQAFQKANEELKAYKSQLVKPVEIPVEISAESMQGQINTLKAQLDTLSKQGRTFGDIEYDQTALALKRAEQALVDYKNELFKTDAQREKEAESARKQAEQQAKLNQKLEEAKQKEAAAAAESARLAEIGQNAKISNPLVVKLREEIERLTLRQKDLEKAGLGPGYKEYDTVTATIKKLNAALTKYTTGTKKAGKETKKLNTGLKNTEKSSRGARMGIGRMLATSILFSTVFRAISAVTGGLKEGMDNLSQYSDDTNKALSMLMSSMTQLKNSFGTAFSPLVEYAAPALAQFINLLSQAVTWTAQLLAALTGKDTFVKAVKVQQDYADSLDKTKDETKDAAKETEKALAPFDKLIQITTGKKKSEDKNELKPEDMFTTEEVSNDIKLQAEAIKNTLGKLFDPLKESWLENGPQVMSSLQNTFSAIRQLASDVGASFMQVWNVEGYGKAITDDLLITFANLVDTVGNLVTNFDKAWVSGDTGTNILRHLGDIILEITGFFRQASESLKEWSANLDFSPLLESFDRILIAIRPIVSDVGNLLLWFLNNVLLPIAKWGIEQALPKVFDLIAAALKTLHSVIEALKPMGIWLWENFLQPLGEWTGKLIIAALEKITEWLEKFSEWINRNQNLIENITIVVATFFAAWKFLEFVNGVKSMINVLQGSGGLIKILTTLASKLDFTSLKYAGMAAAIASVVKAIYDIYKNWDKMTPSEKVISGILAAAGAIAILAVALGAISGPAMPVAIGLAIAAGIAASQIAANAGKRAASSGYSGGYGGRSAYPMSAYAAVPYRMPMLATGTVVPPRAGMFAAILGDNNRETEVVSPLSTMKQALKEALAESNISGGNQIAKAELILDGTRFGQLVVKFGNNEKNRVGVRMVTEGSV